MTTDTDTPALTAAAQYDSDIEEPVVTIEVPPDLLDELGEHGLPILETTAGRRVGDWGGDVGCHSGYVSGLMKPSMGRDQEALP